MQTKLSKLKAMMAAGDWRGAVSLASKFADLGAERDAIKRAQMAYTNPVFCQQIKRCPDAAIAEGQAALIRRYGA